ncbi:hypothetical protein CAEBREN_20405 [Caenorhabditis brenneri]|uniref:PAN-3 domain-containing protein n=1 Tax=Caenorhabditis brenneri TaxID=135651 RepID=G0NPB2_CAEBE|nr:hypothetical protein CAEBREN_20405 [Caenorhabditis brenneri]
MVKMYGKVTDARGAFDYSPPEEDEDQMKSCINYCYESQDCILASFDMASGKCQYYNYTSSSSPVTVKNLTEDSGLYIAIKTTSLGEADTCPVTSDEIGLTYQTPDKKDLPWNQVESGVWEFSGCKSLYQRFTRSSGSSLCLITAKAYEATREVAKKKCEFFDSVVTGVESMEEAEWISNKILYGGYRSYAAGQESEYVEPGPFYYWIDGERVGGGVTNYIYADGMTKEGNEVLTTSGVFSADENEVENVPRCLILVATRNATVKIIDVSCDTYNSAQGVVCAYKLE